jgi:phosphoribosyl 1,2-cyclic phosphodiesterase
MKISVLSSGSEGNSTLIESSGRSILIDSGISGKKLLERLSSISADPALISGIVITHDHADHINGAGVLARKLKIPIFIHRENYFTSSHKFEKCEIKFIDDKFALGSIEIVPFPVSHDGTVNYAYCIISEGKKISHVTDIGVVTTIVKQRILNSDAIILESNHDPEMLKNGPYPWFLKQRISGNKGHLSNFSAGELIAGTGQRNLKHLILGHLSKENNDPSLAFDSMTRVMEENSFDFKLHIAYQHCATELIEL